MNIHVLVAARQDLEDGFEFYEQQKPGIGEYFLRTPQAEIASLDGHAGVHSRCFGHYYRMLSGRFPFAVYYRIEQDTILVDAVLDCRRDPSCLQTRLI